MADEAVKQELQEKEREAAEQASSTTKSMAGAKKSEFFKLPSYALKLRAWLCRPNFNLSSSMYICILPEVFGQLCEDLHPLAAEWRTLGTQLNISAAEQNAIEGEKNRCQNCLEKVLQEWLDESEGPHTKAGLVDVLKMRSVGQIRLAEEILKNKGLQFQTMQTKQVF